MFSIVEADGAPAAKELVKKRERIANILIRINNITLYVITDKRIHFWLTELPAVARSDSGMEGTPRLELIFKSLPLFLRHGFPAAKGA